MELMDIKEEQESAGEDFRMLVEMFKKNFNHIGVEELRKFKTKVSDLTDILRDKGRRDY